MRNRARTRTFIFISAFVLSLLFAFQGALADSLKTIDVPAYIWNHGCSPTSGGMLFGYYDIIGYINLFPGDASTQTQAVYDLIASPEHIRDYYGMPDPNPGGHVNNCIADFMGTSRGSLQDGYTWVSNIDDGLRLYAQYRGYSGNSWNESWGSLTWSDLVTEINNARPMLFHVDSNSDGSLDHSITVMGYKETGGVRYYAARNTWDYSMYWYEFKPIASGQYFGVGEATFFQFTTPLFTDWSAGTASWHTSSNWNNGVPTASIGARVDNGGTAQISSNAACAQLYVGYNASGTVRQTGGVFSIGQDFYLGNNLGSSGTYNLVDGRLSAVTEYIGTSDGGTGAFVQSGGINEALNLYVEEGSTYTLSGGILTIGTSADFRGLLDFANGAGSLVVNGGLADFSMAAVLRAGAASFSSAANTLTIFPAGFDAASSFGSFSDAGLVYSAGSTLVVKPWQNYTGNFTIDDPIEVRGTLTASGGTIVFKNSITIAGGAYNAGSSFYIQNGQSAAITADGGSLSAVTERIAQSGSGAFTQNGGTNTVSDILYLGSNTGSTGTYNLNAGQLAAAKQYIGYTGAGTMTQSGGANTVFTTLYLGFSSGSSGTYNLNDGLLSTQNTTVASNGTSTFNQSGGTHHVAGLLSIGSNAQDKSFYYISGGSLEANDLHIWGRGAFNITDSAASITIAGTFTITDYAKFTAVPGATIHMTGTTFENQSTSSVNMSGLANTTFIYQQAVGAVDAFEIASYDYGLIERGFQQNFAIDGLILDDTYCSTLLLVDNYWNYTSYGPPTISEALYVKTLKIFSHSTLDLNGYRLYAMEYYNYGGAVINGEVMAMEEHYIPEPATISLLALGAIVVLARRWRAERRR